MEAGKHGEPKWTLCIAGNKAFRELFTPTDWKKLMAGLEKQMSRKVLYSVRARSNGHVHAVVCEEGGVSK